jgi:DNA polymerase I-like protein with 3'-5' exonuclease and polymerase domains
LIVFDTESDGFLDEATKLHVINLIDRETEARESYHDSAIILPRTGDLFDGVLRLQDAVNGGRMIAGHNVIRHDIPLIAKFFGFHVHPDQVLDTLVASRLIWTDLKEIDRRAMRKRKRPPEFGKALIGSHSLGAWGYRLGLWKGDYSGPWDTFTQDMQTYGVQDPEVTLALVEKIEAENYSEEAIRLEHRVAEIIFLQERHGVYFDVPGAERLERELIAEKARLEDELRSSFAPWFEAEKAKGRIVEVNPKRRRTAQVTAETGETWRASYEPGEPYCKVKLVSFEPGSRDMIANRLQHHYGWVPTEYSEKTGKPVMDEETLSALEYPEVKLLIRYLVVAKLLGTVATGKKAWLKVVSPDSRIHSKVNTNGAVTGRMTHADHVAQVPRIKVGDDGHPLLGYEGKYGVETRSLFRAAPGKKLVGVDAEGLELRMLAHYMARYDGGSYVETVVNGDKKLGTDVHSVNRKVVGLRTRDGAKTWMYAYLYGAGDLKLGLTFYEDMDDSWRADFNRKYPTGPARERALMQLGSRGRKKIETGLPALGALQKAVKSTAKNTKQLRSLDGRLLNVRAQHSALNTLLQGGGAVVMKKALVLTYDAFLAEGWKWGDEFSFVLNIHDEMQMEANPRYAEKVGITAADAIAEAGTSFDLRCPLSGSADVGQTWADTH